MGREECGFVLILRVILLGIALSLALNGMLPFVSASSVYCWLVALSGSYRFRLSQLVE